MTLRYFLFLVFLFPVLSVAKAPNIIFVLTDDLGYGDLGYTHQNERAAEGLPAFATPNLDRMISEGAWLDNHYSSAPVCAPSRASLMSGRNQGHASLRDNMFDAPIADQVTLASVLAEAGYACMAVGKWGIGGGKAPWPAHPLKRGFSQYYGIMRHIVGHEHYPTSGVYEGYEEVTDGLGSAYTADLFIARSKAFIEEHERENPQQPFFLYLALTEPHAKLQVPAGPYPEGGGLNGGLSWPLDTSGAEPDSYIYPEYAAQDWPMVEKRHATMIRRVDDGLADIVQLLKDLGIDEDTLIIFTSDNGPHDEAGKDGGSIGSQDPYFFESFGPFEGIKRDLFEGGVHVPAFVRWPGTVKAGTVVTTTGAFDDWMPTFAQLAGVSVPARSTGNSLLPALIGDDDPQADERDEYFEYDIDHDRGAAAKRILKNKHYPTRKQMRSLRQGDYKIVAYNIRSDSPEYRLYNVAEDPHEDHNLADDPAYAQLYERMKKDIRRQRIRHEKIARPYDGESVPAMDTDAAGLVAGVRVGWVPGPWKWVPRLDAESVRAWKQAGSLDEVEWANMQPGDAIFIEGYLEVPADGTYALEVPHAWTASVWLDSIEAVDGGLVADGSRSHTLKLEKGLHPVRIYAVNQTGGMPFTLLLADAKQNREQPRLYSKR